VTYIRQTQAELANIEQEKLETEARLAQEQQKLQEEANRRLEAEKQRQRAESERIRAEELRQQAEEKARNNQETPPVVDNSPSETQLNPDSPVNEESNPELNPNEETVNNDSQPINSNSAIETVGKLYSLVSQKQYDQARAIFANPDNLKPEFFNQFSQITVENLQVVTEDETSVTLVGYNTYYYPDGTKQKEERNFTVTKVDDSLKITNSNFIRVIEQRK
jgi:serine/threonine-protein kinase